MKKEVLVLSHSKGQAFAPDFLASIAVFTVMMSVFILSWNSIVVSQEDAREEKALYENAERTLAQLLSSEGVPEDWDQDSVTSLGLASTPHVIEIEKLEEMDELDESEQLAMLNTFNFRLEVKREDDDDIELGSNNVDGDLVVPLRRNAILNTEDGKERVEVVYTVWR